jgi:hypothetical protein
MNDNFSSNNRENVAHGILPKRKRLVRYCNSTYYPNFILLPNGNVQLCCMDFGLQHTMGNLLERDYNSIKADFLKHSKSMELCHYCVYNIPYYKYAFSLAKTFYHKIENARVTRNAKR